MKSVDLLEMNLCDESHADELNWNATWRWVIAQEQPQGYLVLV